MTVWYERHPLLTMALLVFVFMILADYTAGLFLIKDDYNSYRTPHPVYHHDLKPDQAAIAKWGQREYDLYTNSLGFRDAKVREIENTSSKIRILFIGDSFTEGIGVSWNESFTGILDSTLSGNNIEVFNAAVVSYSPKFYYYKVKYLLEKMKFRFNHLYILIDNSDPMNEITYEEFTPYQKNSFKWFSLRTGTFFYKNSYLYYSIKNLLNKGWESPITSNWNRKMGASITDETSLESDEFICAIPFWSENKILYDKWGEKGLLLAEKYMENLVKLCNNYDISVTVVVYPWPPMIQNTDINNLQVSFWKKFCDKNRLSFVNLYPVFITGENPAKILNKFFIPGDVHWNYYGHRLVAKELQKSVETLTH